MLKLNISIGRKCEVCNKKSSRLTNFKGKSVCVKCYEKGRGLK